MVLADLLASYDRLRKRRYSLSERIIAEANQYGYVPQAIPEKEFEVEGPAIFAMADALEGGQLVKKGSPESKNPYTPYVTSRDRVAWSNSVGKVQNERPPLVIAYIRSKQEEFKDTPPNAGGNETDFGKPGAFGPLVPPVTFAPDILSEKAEKAFDKWGLDRKKEFVTDLATGRDAKEDMKRLNDQLQNRGSGPIKDILDSVYKGVEEEEDGMWADDAMLQKSVHELSKGLTAISKVMQENDPDDECLNLTKLTTGERKNLGQFRTRSSGRKASLYWNGDSIMADRAMNDFPGETGVRDYGVKLFGHNTAIHSMAKALGTKKECGKEKEGPIIPHGREGSASEIGLGSTIIGDANEALSTVATIYSRMGRGVPMSDADKEKFSSVLQLVLEKIVKSDTAVAISYLQEHVLTGVRGEEVLEHPYVSHIKDEIDELQERHPRLNLDTGNKVVLTYVAEELRKRMSSVELYGDDAVITRRSSGKGATGVTPEVGPNGEVGEASKRTADVTILKSERTEAIQDNLNKPQGREDLGHLRGGGKPFPGEENQVGVSQKTGKANPSEEFDMGSINLNTLMDAHKMLGLLKTRMTTMRTQNEEAHRLGSEYAMDPSLVDEMEEFCSNEHASEIAELTMLQSALDDPDLTTQRSLVNALRSQMSEGSYDRVKQLYDHKDALKEVLEAKKLHEKNGTKASEGLVTQRRNELMRGWINARRRAREIENDGADARMMAKFNTLQMINGGHATSNQILEINKGGEVTSCSENVLFDHHFNRVVQEHPSVRTKMTKGTGFWSIKCYDSELRPDGKPAFNCTIRKHKGSSTGPHRIKQYTSTYGVTVGSVSSTAEEQVGKLGLNQEALKYHMTQVLRLMEEVGAVDLQKLF